MLIKKRLGLTTSYILPTAALMIFSVISPANGEGAKISKAGADQQPQITILERTHLVLSEKTPISNASRKKQARHTLGAIMLALQKACRAQHCT